MNMFEKAESINAMMQFENMTQGKLAELLGVSQSYIANKIRLLRLGEAEREKILKCDISERHARCLLRLPDAESRITAIDKIHAMNMNVARTEILVDTMLDDSLQRSECAPNYSERVGRFESCLESSLALLREIGLFARLKRDEGDGKIYFSITIG